MSDTNATFLALLSKEKKQSLVSGYIRNEIPEYTPQDIITSCYQFVEERIYFCIKQQELKEFINPSTDNKNIKRYEYKATPNFLINDCLFEFRVSIDRKSENTLLYMICLLSTKEPLIATIWCRAYCKETGIEWRKLVQLKSNQYDFIIPKPKIKDDTDDKDKEKQKNYCGSAGFIDEHIDFDKINELNMEFSMNLVHIKYKKGNHFSGNNAIVLDKHVEFDWNIDENTIKSITDYNTMQLLYSAPFGNDIYCLGFCPNGIDEISEGQCGLYLCLIKLPFGIGGIKVEVKVIFKHDGDAFKTRGKSGNKNKIETVFECQMDYVRTNMEIGWVMSDEFTTDMLKQMKNMKFTVIIELIFVGDEQLNKIPYSQWSQYNVR